MGIKHCETRNFGTIYGKDNIGKAKFLLDFIFRAGKVRQNWNKFIQEHIGVMPGHIWAEIEWRNRKIGSFLESKSFKFDNSEISQQTKFISNIRKLIREYKIYQTKSR